MDLIVAILSLLVIILCVFVFYERIERNRYAYYFTLTVYCIFILTSSKYIEETFNIDWKLTLLGLTLFLTVLWGLHKIQLRLKKKKI